MNYLLDTHTVLWWLFNDPQLSLTAKTIIADHQNTVFVSSASAWEISTKYRIGKLPSASILVNDIEGWIKQAHFSELAITIKHAERAGSWPQPHRDPFDRMLAAQSLLEKMPLISCDSQLSSFGIQMIW